MDSRLIVALIVCAGLAGCAEAPVTQDSEPAFEDLDLEADDTTGVIRGVVIDDSITPIADAKVTLLSDGRTATTNQDGLFGFSAVDPGTHFLDVKRGGFGGVQSSVDVVAGDDEPPILRIQMVRIPGSEPFAQVLQFTGYIGCAYKYANIVVDDACGRGPSEPVFGSRPVPLGIDPDENQVLDFGTQLVPHFLQTEIVWTSTQEFGQALGTIQYVQDDEGNRQRIGNVWGESPLVCTVTRTDVCSNGDGTGGGGDGLNTTKFPGKFWARVYAACYPQCVIGAVGAGLILQQEYTLYSTATFNFMPREGWLLVEDGQVHVPDS